MTIKLPGVQELNLPEQKVEIDAPLVNGDEWLRNLSLSMDGPYSSGYGGPLYAIVDRGYFLQVYAKSRGAKRAELAYAVNAITEDELNDWYLEN